MGPHSRILLPLFLYFLGCCCARDLAPPLVRVNLDTDPQYRWVPALSLFDPDSMRECLKVIISALVPEWIHPIIRSLAEELERFIHKDYAEEIRGLSRALGVSVGDAFLLNLCYEVTTFCTSIVAQDSNGTIYHGRNLDFGFEDYLRNYTIDVEFEKNNEVKYKGTTFIGYVGLWTGQSPHKFTVSGNRRAGQDSWWKSAIASLLRGHLVSWLIRDTLMEAEDFESAVLQLAKTPIIAGVYYIIGGVLPNEGVVITRDRSGPADIWQLDSLNEEWFLVETNYDHWTSPPPLDDRRTPAIKALNATGQKNINNDTLYKVLSVEPVLNVHTIYTTIMCAAQPDQYLTRIRMNPV
ncbi:N-acylethanolamine-hydrolyzing acid amidase [Microcaecilia unicolor]|uniref:N-acylethanolamine-hydrolyzing acid amidase n=1 Tax=Microcaecilia unicolor TaxID=1415580 RepID=A0A6P7X7F5_9AMPH|nr:N-acylethanolamine-hydrolyzing acid amidase [Microcaecilia unicolor]